jgi:hypothetical protein
MSISDDFPVPDSPVMMLTLPGFKEMVRGVRPAE